MTALTDTTPEPLSKRLKRLTHDTHEKLDGSIMFAAPFNSLTGYGRFVGVQYLFHRDIDALYDDAALEAVLPGLTERRRMELIGTDLADLDLTLPETGELPVFGAAASVDVPTALGWLYVAEGSKMGAALLRKEAAKLGLSDDHGARHLAPTPEGPAAHWRVFTAGLDAAELTAEEEARAVAGAQAAFALIQAQVDVYLG